MLLTVVLSARAVRSRALLDWSLAALAAALALGTLHSGAAAFLPWPPLGSSPGTERAGSR